MSGMWSTGESLHEPVIVRTLHTGPHSTPTMSQLSRSNWSTASRQERGYDAEWDRKRKVVLDRDAHTCQCAHCRREERVRVATHVDHIVSREKARALGWTKEQTESLANLQAINEECHQRKTQEERGKSFTPKQVIGEDGFPVVRGQGGVSAP